MREGVLVPDTSSDRMDIRFGLEEYYGVEDFIVGIVWMFYGKENGSRQELK